MRVLVTGGAGFIGSHLTRSLCASGDLVRVLDDFSTGRRLNIADLNGAVEVIQGDVCDPAAVRAGMEDVEVVFHLAAVPSVVRSVREPFRAHTVNAEGTLNCLLAAREAGVRRFIYTSSSSVYGDAAQLPKSEDLPINCKSPYAASKLAGEAYCTAFANAYDIETLSVRLFNVFGPRQDPTSEYSAVIPRFVTAMLRREAPTIFGDGLQTRDFTFVSNVVQGLILAAGADPEISGEVINVAWGDRTSLIELVGILNELLDTDIEPRFAPPRSGEVRDSQADVRKANRLLGYLPVTSVRDGLAVTLKELGAGAGIKTG